MHESWADTRVSSGLLRVDNDGVLAGNIMYTDIYDTNNLVITSGTSPKNSHIDICLNNSELKSLKFLPL